MYFDEEQYKSNYPDLSNEEIIRMFKEDFIDTIYKQWTDEDVYESLEVSDD
jgi:hypothetical protein